MPEFDARQYVAAATPLLNLELSDGQLPGVILNVERIAAMAALVMDFPLDDASEPAPVFRP
jgi:hypothetical protein